MKYVVLIGDGMADQLIPELDNRTPLEAADTPNMDELARRGITGRIKTVPNGLKPGSDAANLSILGYDIRESYTGRAPLEAASAGINLGPDDVAYRCNLVTLDDNIMEDYSAGHISTAEAAQLIDALNEQLGNKNTRFYPGVSYRHLLVISHGPADIETTPPHDLTGEVVSGDGPEGPGSEILIDLMERSRDILENHPVNLQRVAAGKRPANTIWLWGQGKKPSLEKFYDKYAKTGTIITAVDLLKGIGKLIGFDTPDIPGATGYLDTNYQGKVAAAEQALRDHDLVYLHVEAPDEASHEGSLEKKIKAIEDFDRHIVGPIMRHLADTYDNYKILLLPDHATPVRTMTHSAHPVPFVIYGSSGQQPDPVMAYNEIAISDSPLLIEEGYTLIGDFLS